MNSDPEQKSTEAELRQIARLSAPANPGEARFGEAMARSEAIIGRGNEGSWASVWWAYGAIHHEMTDQAMSRALELLVQVNQPQDALAASLMLQAEIKSTQALSRDETPDFMEQISLLERSIELAPEWPALRSRMASAYRLSGRDADALHEAEHALALRGLCGPTVDPTDIAFTGKALNEDYLNEQVAELKLDDATAADNFSLGYYQELEQRLRALVGIVREVDEDLARWYAEYLDHGEYGLAVETAGEHLSPDTPIDRARALARALLPEASLMGLSGSFIDELRGYAALGEGKHQFRGEPLLWEVKFHDGVSVTVRADALGEEDDDYVFSLLLDGSPAYFMDIARFPKSAVEPPENC